MLYQQKDSIENKNIKNVKDVYNLSDGKINKLLQGIKGLKNIYKVQHNHHPFLRKMLKKSLSANKLDETLYKMFGHTPKELPWSEEEKNIFWANWGNIKPYNLKIFFKQFPNMINELTPTKILAHPIAIQNFISVDALTKAMCQTPSELVNLTYSNHYEIDSPFLNVLNHTHHVEQNINKWDTFKSFIPYINKDTEVCFNSSHVKLKAIDVVLAFYYSINFFVRDNERGFSKKELIQTINALKPDKMNCGGLEYVISHDFSKNTIKSVKEIFSLINYGEAIKNFRLFDIAKEKDSRNYNGEYEETIEIFNIFKTQGYDFKKGNYFGENLLDFYIKNFKYIHDKKIFKGGDVIQWLLDNESFDLNYKGVDTEWSKQDIWHAVGDTANHVFLPLYKMVKDYQGKHQNYFPDSLNFILKVYQEIPSDTSYWISQNKTKWFSIIEEGLQNKNIHIPENIRIDWEKYQLELNLTESRVGKIKKL